jgi:hypothetical protein
MSAPRPPTAAHRAAARRRRGARRCQAGTLDILTDGVLDRAPATADLSATAIGTGRELFAMFRANVVGRRRRPTGRIFGG